MTGRIKEGERTAKWYHKPNQKRNSTTVGFLSLCKFWQSIRWWQQCIKTAFTAIEKKKEEERVAP